MINVILIKTLAAKLFPNATHGYSCRGADGVEIDQLPTDCTILAMFRRRIDPDRVFFLVTTTLDNTKYFVLLRVCVAMKNSGYPAFVVIHKIAHTPEAIDELYVQTVRWANNI